MAGTAINGSVNEYKDEDDGRDPTDECRATASSSNDNNSTHGNGDTSMKGPNAELKGSATSEAVDNCEEGNQATTVLYKIHGISVAHQRRGESRT